MAKDVIYGRVNAVGKLVTQRHPSCFGSISSLYHSSSLRSDQSYDRRILITTNFDSVTAHRYAEAFRKTMAKKIVFARHVVLTDANATVDHVPDLPKIKYYGVDHKSIGINVEMVSVCRQNGSPGYWQITIPATVTEYEAYVYVKLFGKIGSMPGVKTEDLAHSFNFFNEEYKGNWRLIITAMGLFGVTSGYNFPFGPSGYQNSKPLIKEWVTGGLHKVRGSVLDRDGKKFKDGVPLFGQALAPQYNRRHVSTAIAVLPPMSVGSGSTDAFYFANGVEGFKSYPFQGFSTHPQDSIDRYQRILVAIRRLLE